MVQDPIEAAVGQWLAFHIALAEDRNPPTSFGAFLRSTKELEKRVGEEGVQLIRRRVRSALAEILEGAPAPPVAKMNVDGLDAVLADAAAERLVAEYRRRGVKPTPEWRADISRKWEDMTARHIAKVQARYAKPAPQPPDGLISHGPAGLPEHLTPTAGPSPAASEVRPVALRTGFTAGVLFSEGVTARSETTAASTAGASVPCIGPNKHHVCQKPAFRKAH